MGGRLHMERGETRWRGTIADEGRCRRLRGAIVCAWQLSNAGKQSKMDVERKQLQGDSAGGGPGSHCWLRT